MKFLIKWTMIKINKDLDDIPESLKPTTEDFFVLPSIPPNAIKTHNARLDIIKHGAYYNEKTYNKFYKQNDIKEKLNNIYHQKCAFCEQRVEQMHIEHYRPKKEKGEDSYAYYWLAFSWDNLLFACPNCNSNKGCKFKIKGIRADFRKSRTELKNINTLSAEYYNIEIPLMVNPEVINPEGYIMFTQDGKIHSDDEKFDYTINACRIDRKDLNDQRRKIIDDFRNHIIAQTKYSKTKDDRLKAIKIVISMFYEDATDKLNTFLAFRKYAISEKWINDIILQEVTN